MKKSKFSEEQIAYALREVESGRPPAYVCRQPSVSEATFYIWNKKYAHLGVSELRRLRSLSERVRASSRAPADGISHGRPAPRPSESHQGFKSARPVRALRRVEPI